MKTEYWAMWIIQLSRSGGREGGYRLADLGELCKSRFLCSRGVLLQQHQKFTLYIFVQVAHVNTEMCVFATISLGGSGKSRSLLASQTPLGFSLGLAHHVWNEWFQHNWVFLLVWSVEPLKSFRPLLFVHFCLHTHCVQVVFVCCVWTFLFTNFRDLFNRFHKVKSVLGYLCDQDPTYSWNESMSSGCSVRL